MQTVQTNATSLKDNLIQWSKRDIPISHGKHLCGRVSWTPHPQSIPVESHLESCVLSFLLHDPNLVAVHAQPFTLSYWDDGRPRHYTPDFLVVFDHVSRYLMQLGFGRWTVIEVKPLMHYLRDLPEITQRLQVIHDVLGFATVCFTERDLSEGRALS